MTIETTTLETTTNNLRTAALQMSLRAQLDKVQKEIQAVSYTHLTLPTN